MWVTSAVCGEKASPARTGLKYRTAQPEGRYSTPGKMASNARAGLQTQQKAVQLTTGPPFARENEE